MSSIKHLAFVPILFALWGGSCSIDKKNANMELEIKLAKDSIQHINYVIDSLNAHVALYENYKTKFDKTDQIHNSIVEINNDIRNQKKENKQIEIDSNMYYKMLYIGSGIYNEYNEQDLIRKGLPSPNTTLRRNIEKKYNLHRKMNLKKEVAISKGQPLGNSHYFVRLKYNNKEGKLLFEYQIQKKGKIKWTLLDKDIPKDFIESEKSLGD